MKQYLSRGITGKNFLRLFILASVLFPAGILFPASYKYNTELNRDTSAVNVRLPDKSDITTYLNDDDFNYSGNERAKTLLEIIGDWFRNLLREILGSEAYAEIEGYIYYILLALALIVVLWGIYRSERKGFLYSAGDQPLAEVLIGNENIHTVDYKILINKAVNSGDYRSAVRYNYLKSLKVLSDNNLINWEINKTNRSYLKELKKETLKNSFNKVTGWFESTWYGSFSVTEVQFNLYSDEFERLADLAGQANTQVDF